MKNLIKLFALCLPLAGIITGCTEPPASSENRENTEEATIEEKAKDDDKEKAKDDDKEEMKEDEKEEAKDGEKE